MFTLLLSALIGLLIIIPSELQGFGGALLGSWGVTWLYVTAFAYGCLSLVVWGFRITMGWE